MAGEMALVGKAGRRRNIRQPVACADHRTRLLQPPHEQITMRACCKSRPKVPGERKAVETGDSLKLAGSHGFRGMRFEIVARQSCALPRHAAERPLWSLRMFCKSARNTRNEIVDEQLVELAIELCKGSEQRTCKNRIPDDRIVNEGKPDLLRSKAFEQ